MSLPGLAVPCPAARFMSSRNAEAFGTPAWMDSADACSEADTTAAPEAAAGVGSGGAATPPGPALGSMAPEEEGRAGVAAADPVASSTTGAEHDTAGAPETWLGTVAAIAAV